MTVCALAIVSAVASTEACAQSLFARGVKSKTYRALVSDHTAYSIGDILTIVIKEEHKVNQDDKVNRTQKSTLAAKLESFKIKPDVFKASLLPDIDVRSSKSFEGNGKQQKDGKFEARIAATVKDVLPNGNLVVSGRRTIVIDDEQKSFQLSGIVRAVDISAGNTVSSTQVAEAKISLTGTGKNTEFTTKGPIGKLIETAWWLVWPF
ncbi:MAG: flagellar basal body L-ring protein FlgH [Planctomycetota bacterium]